MNKLPFILGVSAFILSIAGAMAFKPHNKVTRTKAYTKGSSCLVTVTLVACRPNDFGPITCKKGAQTLYTVQCVKKLKEALQ